MKAAFVLILLISCCLAVGCDQLKPMDRKAELDNVFEAILRYDRSRQPHDLDVYLTLNGKRPSPEFLQRFDPTRYHFVDTIKDDPRTWVESLRLGKWISNNEVEVHVSYYCGDKCSGSYTLLLIRKDKNWSVTKKYNEEVQ